MWKIPERWGRGKPHPWHWISGLNNWVNSGPFTEIGLSGQGTLSVQEHQTFGIESFWVWDALSHPNGEFQRELDVKDWHMENWLDWRYELGVTDIKLSWSYGRWAQLGGRFESRWCVSSLRVTTVTLIIVSAFYTLLHINLWVKQVIKFIYFLLEKINIAFIFLVSVTMILGTSGIQTHKEELLIYKQKKWLVLY